MTVSRSARRRWLPALFVVFLAAPVHAGIIYDSTPSPLPGNVPSLGYQATSTAEFGDRIAFGPGGRDLTNVRITLSDWAKFSDYPSMNPSGWTHPLTLNLYNVGAGGTLGSLIYSTTVTANIPWRPEPYGFNGIAFNVDFALPNVTVPNEIIYGLAFNTETHGYTPIGAPGPYNSLNFGLSGGTSVGTDVNSDNVFWNTSFGGFYTDGGAGGVGIFREDTNWTPFVPAAQFSAAEVPEPATLAVLGATLAAGWVGHRARRRKA